MQVVRPIVTCRVGEVAKALSDQGIYVDPTSEAFAQKVKELFKQTLKNISYDLESHTQEIHTKELLQAIQTIRP